MAAHRYDRLLDPASGNSLARLAHWIPTGGTVLELGPAGGYFTRYLKETLGCVVDAVELDPAMADDARPWCRRMIVGDLEALSLSSCLAGNTYDAIVIADVIEHLRDPAPLLRELRTLLTPEGACLISVPNIAYGGVIAELMQEEFGYRPEGLLDRTHLRFFTWKSFAALLEETGWHAWDWNAVNLPFLDSEFHLRVETLPTPLRNLLHDHPRLQCYQWLVRARLAPPPEPAVLPEPWTGDRFPLRLFWADDPAHFDYTRSALTWGVIGSEWQTCSIDLPTDAATTHLRLRLADRPGYVRLYEVTIADRQGKIVWRWTPADGLAALAGQSMDIRLAAAGDHALAVLDNAESWLDLAWHGRQDPESGTAQRITLSLGWPMSADFRAASAAWNDSLHPIRQENESLKSLVALRDSELANRDASLGDLRERLTATEGRLREESCRLGECAEQVRQLTEQNQLRAGELLQMQQTLDAHLAHTATLQTQIARMQTLAWWLKRPLHWLRKLV